MDVSEAKRLKTLEAENAKLKRLYADAMLDSEPCRAIGPSDNGERAEGAAGKKMVTVSHCRAIGPSDNGERQAGGGRASEDEP